MGQIINEDNFKNVLYKVNYSEDEKSKMLDSIETLYLYLILLDIYKKNLNYESLINDFDEIEKIERIGIYIFSKSLSPLNEDITEVLKEKGLEISALFFEKLGDLIGYYEVQEINEKDLILKATRYFMRSAIAYTLIGNIPNAVLNSEKALKLLKKLNLNTIDANIYMFFFKILSKDFSYKFDVKIFNDIFKFINNYYHTGDLTELRKVKFLLEFLPKRLDSFIYRKYSNYFNYIRIVIEKMEASSVWSVLKGKVSEYFIRQLVTSNPPIKEFWNNQLEVLTCKNSFLLNDYLGYLINFPTSGGKTLLAEIAIQKNLEEHPDKICVYVAPTNALVNEIYRKFNKRYKPLGYKVGLANGGFEFDNTDEKIFKENIVICTPEKLLSIVRNDLKNNVFNSISLIVLDEFHKIQDKGRGIVLENILWYVLLKNKESRINLIMLSAILDNSDEIIRWFDFLERESTLNFNYNLGKIISIKNSWKPTKLLKGKIKKDISKELINGRERWKRKSSTATTESFFQDYFIDYGNDRELIFDEGEKVFDSTGHKLRVISNESKTDYLIRIINSLSSIGPNLLFFLTKKNCLEFVDAYTPNEDFILSSNLEKLINYIKRRLGTSHLLVKALNKGLMYHTGDLPLDIREALEIHFKFGEIKTIVSTTTLAEGVNLPINNIIYSGKMYSGQNEINIGDFKNIVGRAGRAYQNSYGQVLFVDDYWFPVNEELFNYETKKNNISGSLNDDEVFEKNIKEVEDFSVESNLFYDMLLMLFNNYEVNEDTSQLEKILNYSLSYYHMNEVKKKTTLENTKKFIKFCKENREDYLKKIQLLGITIDSYEKLKVIAKELCNNYQEKFSIEGFINEENFSKLIGINEFIFSPPRRNLSWNGKKIEISHYEFLVDWVDQKLDMSVIREKYFSEVDERYRDTIFEKYINENIKYKLSWAFNCLSRVIDDISPLDLNMFLGDISKFIMFGLNNFRELELVRLGFSSRNFIIELSELLEQNYSDAICLEDFLINTVDTFTLKSKIPSLTDYEIKQYIYITNNLKKIELAKKVFQTRIMGIFYNLKDDSLRNKIISEFDKTKLELRHDKENYYDENAIEILYDKVKIGYVSRSVNENILYYLSNNSDYNINVLSWKNLEINLEINFL